MEVIEEKVKEKVSLTIKVYSIIGLFLFASNIASLFVYFQTVINWYNFVLFSFLMSIPVSILVFYIIKLNQDKAKEVVETKADYKKQEYNLLELRIGALVFGLILYVVFLLFVPLGLNYFFSDRGGIEFETTDFSCRVERDDIDYGTTIEKHYFSYLEFNHQGVLIKLKTEQQVRSRLVYTIQKGFLGFDVIKDKGVSFKNFLD